MRMVYFVQNGSASRIPHVRMCGEISRESYEFETSDRSTAVCARDTGYMPGIHPDPTDRVLFALTGGCYWRRGQ
jgi:hypothetical protein